MTCYSQQWLSCPRRLAAAAAGGLKAASIAGQQLEQCAWTKQFLLTVCDPICSFADFPSGPDSGACRPYIMITELRCWERCTCDLASRHHWQQQEEEEAGVAFKGFCTLPHQREQLSEVQQQCMVRL